MARLEAGVTGVNARVTGVHKRLDGLEGRFEELPCDDHSKHIAQEQEREQHRRSSDTWRAKLGLVLVAAALAFAGGVASWGLQRATSAPSPTYTAEVQHVPQATRVEPGRETEGR